MKPHTLLHLPLTGIVVTHSAEGNPRLCEMASDSTHVRTERLRCDDSSHQPRDRSANVAVAMSSTGEAEWRVLENGVLATPTSIEVVTERGRRCIWCDPRGGGRLVCEHGWGAYHLNAWNGPRAHRFPKPSWTTCDCRSATGLCGGRRSRAKRPHQECEELEAATGSTNDGGESDCTVLGSRTKPLPYYDVLLSQHGTTELRTGLHGTRVPGVVGADGEPFYMVKGDVANVLRCRHGHTTNMLAVRARERRRHAASLVAAAVLGPCVVRKALGGVAGVAGAEATSMGYGTRRALVRMLLALHEAREAKRARRSASLPCGCSAVHLKAHIAKRR